MTDTPAVSIQELAMSSQEAGQVADAIVEGRRAAGESYVEAVKRLQTEQSPDGDRYRRAMAEADQYHRQLSKAASLVPAVESKFTVTKRLAEGMCEVVIAKSDAEAELDRLAKQIEQNEGVDFYDAYDRAAKANPDLHARAVAG